MRILLGLFLLALAACRPQISPPGGAGADVVPRGPLPRDVVPVAYTLELEIVPARDGFSGRTQIAVRVERDTSRIWLHGQALRVEHARVVAAGQSVTARYTQVDATGVARLDLDSAIPAGPALIEIEYSAPFHDGLSGLYAVQSGESRYVFSQFEPLEARRAFPSFDEPAFKTPFDLWLTVPAEHVAITNTLQVGVEPVPGGLKRLHFATTKPLPTYLIGISVGTFDVVEGAAIAPSPQRAQPLPLRGIAVKGKGAQLAHALKHTGPLLLELERYYDIAYPYAKLDLIAVPDFGAGAMENAAAITFREWLLLLDGDSAPEGQRRAFASVMAHELAHHWFGNLVTMPWWDDIWLNEGFATWSAARTVAAVHPDHGADVDLASSVQHVMTLDGRVSARTVRQPVPTNGDMGNAFDGITYEKGAGILRMFERYLGEALFRQGVQTYLRERAFGVGASADLLETLGRVAGRPVAPAFDDFLQKPGVPLLEVTPSCDAGRATLALRQSRYLPLGSTGERDQQWKLPLCVRFGTGDSSGEQCTMLEAPEGTLELEGGCPDWVMPNARGAGYYIWSLSSEWLTRLREHGYDRLDVTERLSLAHSVDAAHSSGALEAADLLALLPRFAADPAREVAVVPIDQIRRARDDLVDAARRPRLEQYGRDLYAERFAKLGYEEREGEDGEERLLRGHLARFLADVARDPDVRARLAALGAAYLGEPEGPLQPDRVAADLRRAALVVALEDGTPALYDRALARLAESEDASARGDLLSALSSVTGEQASKRALGLVLDPRLKLAEVLTPLWGQMGDARTRDAAFAFLQANYDAIIKRASPNRAGRLPLMAASDCEAERGRQLQAFFAERIEQLSGGPRNLSSALESITLCVALKARQGGSANAFVDSLAASAGK